MVIHVCDESKNCKYCNKSHPGYPEANWAFVNQGRSIASFAEGVQVFHGVVHERALLPTLLCSLQRYYPNITII